MNILIDDNVNLKIEDKYEKALADYMTTFSMSVLKAAETFKPNLIADYLYELSKKINSFYNNCPILNQEEEVLKSRAYLVKKAGMIMQEGLNLLGIPVLEKM